VDRDLFWTVSAVSRFSTPIQRSKLPSATQTITQKATPTVTQKIQMATQIKVAIEIEIEIAIEIKIEIKIEIQIKIENYSKHSISKSIPQFFFK
jgi:hypothetical protein